ncbi:hypothetical protein SDC9_180551 [bioreactor metagenome]|uniref:Uncharacterized protein n=1 Tax=bioreactor metagenome TaxID=1076179 RepID=A0A645H233_9ZZZZ
MKNGGFIRFPKDFQDISGRSVELLHLGYEIIGQLNKGRFPVHPPERFEAVIFLRQDLGKQHMPAIFIDGYQAAASGF